MVFRILALLKKNTTTLFNFSSRMSFKRALFLQYSNQFQNHLMTRRFNLLNIIHHASHTWQMLHFEHIFFSESFRSINKFMIYRLLYKIKHCNLLNHAVAVLFQISTMQHCLQLSSRPTYMQDTHKFISWTAKVKFLKMVFLIIFIISAFSCLQLTCGIH